MRLWKDSTVRAVVVWLLVAVLLLVPLSVVMNRISLGENQGFNLAEVFAYSRGLHAQEPAAAVGSDGDVNGRAGIVNTDEPSSVQEAEGEKQDFDTSILVPVSSRNETDTTLEGSGEQSLDADSVDERLAAAPEVENEADGDVLVVSSENATALQSREPTAPPLSSPSPVGAEVATPIPVATVASTSGVLYENAVNRSEAKRQRVFQPASLPHYSFVKFSAYRQSLHTFFVTGITSYVARSFDKDRVAHSCEWHPADGASRNGSVETEARMMYMKGDENHGTYNPTIINCTFRDAVGADRRGGLLVLRISTGYDRWEPNLPVVAMEEQPGEVDVVMTPPEKVNPNSGLGVFSRCVHDVSMLRLCAF